MFWALVVFGGMMLILVGVALPESARNLIGNGSVEARGWSRTWWPIVKQVRATRETKELSGRDDQEIAIEAKTEQKTLEQPQERLGTRGKFKLANPMAAIRIIFYKDTALVL